MPASNDDIQARLFEMVSQSVPDSVSLVDELCALLKQSNNTVYRRMNGKIPLNINEVAAICDMYNISFDSLRNFKGNSVVFDFNPMEAETNYMNYLLSIRLDLEKVHLNKNGYAIYAAEDIPLFYNFCFPALARFKLFYWLKSVMNVPSLQGVKYRPELINEDLVIAGRELYDSYARLRSVEIWTEMTATSLIKQIEFCWEAGLFESKEVALAVCEDIKQLFTLLESSAMQGCKFDSQHKNIGISNNYQLYWSEIEIGNNCILTETDDYKTAYLAFNTFNKLSTHNQLFCEVINSWLKNLVKKSNLISDISEKKRLQFFNLLNDQIELTRKKILG